MEKINIGKIVNVVGLKGEVKVYNYSDSVDAYVETPEVYVGDKLTKIEKVRLQKNMVVLKLEGIND
jgi:16S rRNA processing protein RimM